MSNGPRVVDWCCRLMPHTHVQAKPAKCQPCDVNSEFVLYDGGLVSSAVLFQVNTWDLQGQTPKPLPLLTSGPELLVHFESRLEVDKYTASMNLGMNATFDWVTVAPGAPCVGGCTSPQAGTCVNGVCQCNAGYFGADCG